MSLIKGEFPDFDMGGIEVPEQWVDNSWHNDVCPSFKPTPLLTVWIDYVDPARREREECGRFAVIKTDSDDQFTENLLETDDFDQVLTLVKDIKDKANAHKEWVEFIQSRTLYIKPNGEACFHYGAGDYINIVDNSFQLPIGRINRIGFNLSDLELDLFNFLYGYGFQASDVEDAKTPIIEGDV